MAPIRQVIVCGFGGQGIVLAGSILGQAAFNDRKYISSTNSYGSAARGGACRAEVVISDKPIIFPYVIAVDMLIAMYQTAYNMYIERVKPGEGVVIFDECVIPKEMEGLEHIGIPAIETAVRELGDGTVANVIILSAAVNITEVVSKEALESAIREIVPERLKQLNLKAMDIGYRLGRNKSNQIHETLVGKSDRLTPVVGRTHIPLINQEMCHICDLCRLLCPDLAVTRNDNMNQIEIDYSYCKGCGICTTVCPRGAIKMILEDSVG
jgi:2-oxoglutarate ferredoxin oxidoreductase subunit gamma